MAKAVTLHNIGCETEGGKFGLIVPKNTPLPTKKSDVYTTAKDNQSSVEVHILEGKGERVADNRSLGRFYFDGIPPAPKAVPQIELVYKIDTGGKLYIHAKDLGTGKKQSAIMEERVRIIKTGDEETLNGINDVHSLLQQAKKHSINTKSEEEKLNDAKLKFDRNEFSKVIVLAIECKNSLNWKIDKYKKAGEKSAKQSLDYAYSKIKEAEKLGINVSCAQDLHKKAIREFDNREYEKAVKSAENCKKFTEDEISRYIYAKEQIRTSKDVVENVKRIVPIPKAESSIKNADAALEIGNYNSAFKLAKRGEGEALKFKQDYERYKETSDFISSIESEMRETESFGVKIPKSNELIEQAKSEQNKNNFEKAKESANEAKKRASERKEAHRMASFSISSASNVLIQAKREEIDVSSVEDLLSRAKSSLNKSKYEEAFELAKKAEKDASRLKGEHEAHIETSDFISSIESEITEIRSSGVKIPKTDEIIEQAKLGLINNNFEKAKELANEAKNMALESEKSYKKALNSITSVGGILSDAKGYGIEISNAEKILMNARELLDKGEYEEAYDLSKETERIAKETDTKYREAKDWIKSAEATIEKAKEFCTVSEAEDTLDKAKSAFSEGTYKDAVKYARQAEETAKKLREESKPMMEVDLPEKTFTPNYWKTLNLIVRNRGNAHAKEVKLIFSKEVEVKGQTELSVNSGKEENLSIVLKPNERGDVPLEIKTTYKDADGKEYSAENHFTLNVTEKPAEEPPRREGEYETSTEKKEVTIERAIYDSCKRDFIERALPRMKEWINRYDPGAYWLAVSIQNNTDTTIEEWGVELETSSVIKIKEARVEGVDYDLELHESHPVPYKNTYAIGLPKEYGIVIPNGGAQRVYFKLRAEKPKTVYEITGVFKSRITGDILIRAKKFKYWCDAGMPPEAVKAELKKTFSEKDAALLALSFKTVQEIDRMCNHDAKTEEYLDKILTLKNHTEGFNVNFTKHVDKFSRFMEQEQIGYLDDEYKGKVRRFCTNLLDVWIAEFLR